jgi:putative intracellular protease/amidase
MARVLVPLPDTDFDPTETAVPWKVLSDAGHEVVFATEEGKKPACDHFLVRDEGVLFGQLGAKPGPKALYRELESADAFTKPMKWSDIDPGAFDGLVLPGGHAPGMKQYLASDVLKAKVSAFAKSKKPLGAICHGVVLLARADGLRGRKTTCLPKYMEKIAYYATAWKIGRYYRTYDAYVEDEVKDALSHPSDFVRGPLTLFSHGTADDDSGAFVVESDEYVSARWPGDAYLFAKKIAERLA